VSKIFDSLKRAEAERKNRAKQTEAGSNITPIRTASVTPAGVDTNGFPEDLLRQLGILKNAVDSILKGKERKTIVFTSAVSGEGTTTIGSSFARLLALQGGGRVLLCEMNARNPALKKLFGLNGDLGITDFFSGERNLPAVVHTTREANLDVIPIGKEDPALIQIHLQNVFPELARQASAIYETVIFDAPAIVNSPETAPMAAHVDGVVLVVHSGKTKREVVQRSIETIHRSDGAVLGVVLNRKKYYIPEFLYKRI
jgi:protein-tyrosine kinase